MPGKLNGVITATTPTGWRIISSSMPEAMSSRLLPIISDGMPVATSTFSMPRRSSPCDSASVLPHSWVISLARSAKWVSSRALRRNSGWMRSPGGVRRQAGSASDAALTARATSAAPDRGACADDLARRRVTHRRRLRHARRFPPAADVILQGRLNEHDSPDPGRGVAETRIVRIRIVSPRFRVSAARVGVRCHAYMTTIARPTMSPRASAAYAASASASGNRCVTIASGRKIPRAASRIISGMSLRVRAP